MMKVLLVSGSRMALELKSTAVSLDTHTGIRIEGISMMFDLMKQLLC